MDPYERALNWVFRWHFDPHERQLIRAALGHTRRFAERMDLAEAAPHQELASSGYCLANPTGARAEYCVYLPQGGSVTVDLSKTRGAFAVEWFDAVTGESKNGGTVKEGARRALTSPFKNDSALYLHKRPAKKGK